MDAIPMAFRGWSRQSAGRVARMAMRMIACALGWACAAQSPQSVPAPATGADEAPAASRCFAALPESVLTQRDTIYLHAYVPDSADRGLLPWADSLTGRVGYELRLLLGGGSHSLPPGEPTVTWRSDLRGPYSVTMHRNGHATWRGRIPADSADSMTAGLLASAISAVERVAALTWPPGIGPDSMIVQLGLEHAGARPPARPGESSVGYYVFVLRTPPESRPEVLWHPALHFPALPEGFDADAHVVMEAIVDTTGRAERGSVRDIWPAGVPPYTGLLGEEYARFVETARSTVLGARFRPGHIAGCAVRVRVQIPFNFTHPAWASP